MSPRGRTPASFLLALFLAFPLAACSADSPWENDPFAPPDDGVRPWNRPRAYGSLAFGTAGGGLPDYEEEGTEVSSASTTAVAVGWRFGQRLSVETGFEYIEGDVDYDGFPVTVWKLYQVPVQGKIHFLEGRFQPHLVGGAGWYWLSDEREARGVFARAGAGFDWNFADSWALEVTGSWDQPIGGRTDLNHSMLQFGILFRF